MTVVSIDPSLTGFAVVVGGPGREPEIFEKATKPVKTLRERVARMFTLTEFACNIIKQQDDVELVLIENYAFNARGSSGVTLGELGMYVRSHVLQLTPCLVEVPPTTLKKFITGKGNAGKVEVASHLSKRYGVVFSSDNKADAFGLYQLGMQALGHVPSDNKAQEGAVKQVQDLIKVEKGEV